MQKLWQQLHYQLKTCILVKNTNTKQSDLHLKTTKTGFTDFTKDWTQYFVVKNLAFVSVLKCTVLKGMEK